MFWKKKSEIQKVLEKYGRVKGHEFLTYFFTITDAGTEKLYVGETKAAKELMENAISNILNRHGKVYLDEYSTFQAEKIKNEKLITELRKERIQYTDLTILVQPTINWCAKTENETYRETSKIHQERTVQANTPIASKKKLSEFKVLEPIELDVDFILQGNDKDTRLKVAIETDKYTFYSYHRNSEYGWHLLRQDKKHPEQVVYFGYDQKNFCLFNNLLFYATYTSFWESSIEYIDPETGKRRVCDWLSKDTFSIMDLGYNQDVVQDLFLHDGNLVAKVKRNKSDIVSPIKPFDLDTTYYLCVGCENNRYFVSRFFTQINLEALTYVKTGLNKQWSIMQADGSYFLQHSDKTMATTTSGYILKTAYLPIAEKLLEELEIYGNKNTPYMTLLSWHSTMSDVFVPLVRSKAEQRLGSLLFNENEWFLSSAVSGSVWDILIDENNNQTIKRWINKTSYMQMNAIYCLGMHFNSIRLPYILAFIMEYIPEEHRKYVYERLIDFVSQCSPHLFGLKDIELFEAYYGVHLKDVGPILKKMDIIDSDVLEKFLNTI